LEQGKVRAIGVVYDHFFAKYRRNHVAFPLKYFIFSPLMLDPKYIRNIAIVAHVDHGKTTLVDQLLRQSGTFGAHQELEERVMDSMDLERERGITIMSKNASIMYKGYKINIVDTPGHADFGGQVERVLNMVEGVLLVVDAQDGPMAQTTFVLKKAMAKKLKPIVVINKIDRPFARPFEVQDEVFDLFVHLNAEDHQLDFPTVFASAREGYARRDPKDPGMDMQPLFDEIIKTIPPPTVEPDKPFQMQVATIEYSPFMGRLAIGRLQRGVIKVNAMASSIDRNGKIVTVRLLKLYGFQGLKHVEIPEAVCGDILVVAGFKETTVGDTITDPLHPDALPAMEIDQPTMAVNFIVNTSPFAGLEGTYVTSRHLRERLYREVLADVALRVEDTEEKEKFKVSGRGELHLTILMEKMRREGYEFAVTPPEVNYKYEHGKKLEPIETLFAETPAEYQGRIIEMLGRRQGRMINMEQTLGIVKLTYKIPVRGMSGMRSQMLSETKGYAVMHSVFSGYEPYYGEVQEHSRGGAMVVKETCITVAYALYNLQERGTLLMGPGIDVYAGQVIGICAREQDICVNPAKGKKLTNMRAAGTDESIDLTPHKKMSLEENLEFIQEDELLELTPKSMRVRKKILDENGRKRMEHLDAVDMPY
jgi:GTP-binding protein